MKHLLSVCLTLLLVAAALPAGAETVAEPILEGLVTEVTETGFLMNDLTLGATEVLLADDTAYEGATAAREDVAVGQYLFVRYDGKLTRSLPPQATARKVSCFAVTGLVDSVMEDGSVLVTGDAIFGDVLVRFDPEQAPMPLISGLPVTVYYNGVMAMSLPGQIGALHIDTPAVSGTVSDLTAESFTLTAEDGALYAVLLTPDTLGAQDLFDGVYADVLFDGQLTEDDPPTLTALWVFVASARVE